MKKPLRVLFVEDSEDDALLMLRELRKGGYDPVSMRVDTAPELPTPGTSSSAITECPSSTGWLR